MILIGSRALLFRAPKILDRKPEDFDLLGREDEVFGWLKENSISDYIQENNRIIVKDQKIEIDLIETYSSNSILEDLILKDSSTIYTKDFGAIPNLDLLFTLKASHRYLKNSPHFWKTVFDYHRMKSIGAKIRPEYMEFFKLREKETYARQPHPKLNVSKKDFFDEKFEVIYDHDHDDVHKSVALGERPAYTYYLKDGAEIDCDKNKFFAIDEKIQLAGVIEEACVLAIERSLVPHPGKMTPRQAWIFALSKVCSSITSGWFREFAYENIFEVIKNYPENYWERFQNALKNGKVRKVKNEQ